MIPTATRRHLRISQKSLAVLVLLCSLIAIGVLTLRPTADTDSISFWCLKCGDRPAVDVLLNILLFVPLGTGLALYGVRFRRAALLALACTCSIETLQFFAIAGRYASLRDILTNFAGALIGYALGRHWRILLAPNHAAASMVATMAAVLWLGTQSFTAWAMGISPPPEPWWAQLRPNHEEYPAIFTDQIVAVSLGSTRIRYRGEIPSEDADAMRAELLAGAPFNLVLTNVATRRPLAPIAVISAGPVHDVVWWEQDKRDAVLGVTVRGTLMGLRTPSVRIVGAFPKERGDTIALAGSYLHGWYELQATSRSSVHRRELRASPSWGWSFLLPFPFWPFGSTIPIITGFYLAAVWCVVSYWSSRSVHAGDVTVPLSGIAAAILLGLGIVPIVFALPVAHWSEWVAALAGGAAGWVIGQASRRSRGSRGALPEFRT